LIVSRIRLWLRRAVILLVLLAILVGVGAWFLYFHRDALPAAPPHARVAPIVAPLKGFVACWVETGSTFTGFPFAMTAGSILVKHPAGDLLIDTGNSMHFDDEIAGYPFLLRLKLKNLAGQLNPEVPLPELMRLVGGDPTKIRWVILSHVHLDHAGGLMDLPRVPVLLTREELQFALDPAVQAKGFVIPTHTQRFPPADSPTLKFDPRPYETFDESTDLYGDGSVVVVPLRGHTPGSVGVFVNLDPHRRLFYVGDAIDEERAFQDRVGKSLLLRDSDNDPTRANQIVAKLNQLHAMVPELAIIPAHGRSAYLKFFPGGALSCVSSDAPR
jgi:glyoxylase-like metal-dependent hydrolase (beta-lactamase superfamily II)